LKPPSINTFFAAVVERTLDNALSGSSAAQHDLKQLDGKTIAVELKELPLQLYFLPRGGKLHVHGKHDGPTDIAVRAASFALLEAAWKRGETPPRGIVINGDAETAQTFSRLLKNADLDWEELLSRYVGDMAAHQIGSLTRDIMRWGKDAADRIGQDMAEYLVYESAILPPRHAVESFLDEVDRLNSDVDRLAARLQRLHTKHQQP
jgi:ubiquinone biosynthesis accessory factor UbiJ